MDSSIEIISPPEELTNIYEIIFSEDLKDFVVKICRQFDSKIDRIFVERLKRRVLLEERELLKVDESLESLADFVAKEFTGLQDRFTRQVYKTGLQVRFTSQVYKFG
jgi:hypothetical protein